LISKGYLRDENCTLREPPYPLFLSQNKKYIIMMLYDNIIKVIPVIHHQQQRIQLSSAFNIRIMHSEIIQVIPINYINETSKSQIT
jgi:hypothetical protein